MAVAGLDAVLGDLRRITQRRPLIVLGSNPQARLRARDLRLRSVQWPSTATLARTPMTAGIAATLRSLGGDVPAVLSRWPT